MADGDGPRSPSAVVFPSASTSCRSRRPSPTSTTRWCYARAPHEQYLRRYGDARPSRVLLMGMNPGPFGMAQTGVPFGDVRMVRDFLGIEAPVARPPREHPARPITGFACARSEVSGTRLWGWARDRFGTAERFFERFFVVNYCPLVFMEESGRNRTPDKLPPARAPAAARCLRRGPARRSCDCCGPRTSSAWAPSPRRARARGAGRPGAVTDRLHPAPQPGQPRRQPRLGRPGRTPAARARGDAALMAAPAHEQVNRGREKRVRSRARADHSVCPIPAASPVTRRRCEPCSQQRPGGCVRWPGGNGMNSSGRSCVGPRRARAFSRWRCRVSLSSAVCIARRASMSRALAR